MTEEETRKECEEQPMLEPRVEKVVVNISVGKSGEPLEKASKVMKELTGQTPSKRKAKRTIRDFGIRKDEPIACVVTLRKQRAMEFLKKVLPVIDNRVSGASFDEYGNFAFGIKEHIEIAGVKYDPEVGIFGMDVCVSLARPGYRVKNRKRRKARVGSSHILTREEAMAFARNILGVEIT
ncbi:MAG: 50S ribosomal protein L5 [Candidatus Bathycorpusculaceae bacterium]